MSFSDDIKKFAEKTEKKAGDVFRGTALSIFGKIVLRTPVDTGRLRGNWQIGINKQPSGELANISQPDSSGIMKADIGDTIWITNNLPYAQAIENGHSQGQAPQGMVKITIAEYERIVNQQARK